MNEQLTTAKKWTFQNPPNPARIQLARNLKGILQGELSKLLGHTTQAIVSNLETEKTEFTHDHAKSISEVLNLPVSFFYKKKNFTRLSKFYYRKRNAFPASKLIPLESKIEVIRSLYTELLKSVEFQTQQLPAIRVNDKNKPDQIASTLRLFLNLGEDPIPNLVGLIEKLGIPVIFLDVDSDKFSGMTLQTDINQSIIVVNKNMPNDHKRFTIAHELGHLIMHIPFSEEAEFYDNLEDLTIVEKQADQFAGAFLIPTHQAKYQFKNLTYSKLADFKVHWKVSKQAVIYRAKDAGAINETKFKTLFIELSRFGERKNEKIEIAIDQPTLFNKIIQFHEKNLELTKKEIAEDLAGISEIDFNEWFGFRDTKLRMVIN
jgi:Zn-dependent peptidase ImmA (M78 family)/DNA-binding XRE family transcriptional regulator